MHLLCAAAHHLCRVRRAHVERDRPAKGLGEHLAQLADVAVRFAAPVNRRAGEGQNRRSARFLQLFVIRAAQPAVHQHDLVLDAREMHGQQIFSVIKLAVQAARGRGLGAFIAGDFIFLGVGRGDGQFCVMYPAAGDLEFLDMRLRAGRARDLEQPLCRPLFIL